MSIARKRSHEEFQSKTSTDAEKVLKILNNSSLGDGERMRLITNVCLNVEIYMSVLRELCGINPGLLRLLIEVPLSYAYNLSYQDFNELYTMCLELHKRLDARMTLHDIRNLGKKKFVPEVDTLDCLLSKNMEGEFHMRHGDLNQILENPLSSRGIPDILRKILSHDMPNLPSYAIYKEIGIDNILMLMNATIITKKDASWSGLPERLCYVESLSPLRILVLDLIGAVKQVFNVSKGKLGCQDVWKIRPRDLDGKLFTYLGNGIVPCAVTKRVEAKHGRRILPLGDYYCLTFAGPPVKNLYRVDEFLSNLRDDARFRGITPLSM